MTGRIFIAILLSLWLFSTAANAYNCCPYPRAWYIELEPFYAQINENILSHHPFAEERVFDTEGCRRNHFLNDNDWNFGFRVALGTDFASCTPCRFGWSLEYTRFQLTDDHSLVNDSQVFFSGFSDLLVGPFVEANARLKTTYDAGDLLLHYNAVYGRCLDIRYFAGVRYIRLENDLNVNFRDDEFDLGDLHQEFDLRINGIGPRVGFDVFLPLACCFGIQAEASGSLLYGWDRHDHHESLDTLQLKLQRNNEDRHYAIPAISGELGLAYHTTYCGCQKLNFEVGYRYDRYFNLKDGFNTACSCDHCGCHQEQDEKHDFEFSGPYLKSTIYF